MTLEYREIEPLAIPPEAFGSDGVAKIVLSGGSQGAGTWEMRALFVPESPLDVRPIGAIEVYTSLRQPDLVVDAAVRWVKAYCDCNGYQLARSHNMNHEYGLDEAPFYALAAVHVSRRRIILAMRGKVR